MSSAPPTFEITRETAAAVSLLGDCPEGGIVTYRDLRKAIGEDPQGPGRAHVSSARRILQREKRMVFRVLENVGLRHLPPLERLELGRIRRIRARRQCRRGLDELQTVQDLKTPLDDDQRLRFFLERTALEHVLLEASRSPGLRAIGGAVLDKPPPIG